MDETSSALLDLINDIPITEENEKILEDIREAINNGDMGLALEKMDGLPSDIKEQLNYVFAAKEEEKTEKNKTYPEELSD